MNTRSIVISACTAALFAVSGAVAQNGVGGIDCGVQFEPVNVGSGLIVNAHVMHRLVISDDTLGKSVQLTGVDIGIDTPIPNKLPGFATLASALDTGFTVKFYRGRSSVYAECFVYASRALGFSGDLSYAMRIEDNDGEVTWHGGVCDIEPWTDGVQPGVPDMYAGDTVTTYVPADGELVRVMSGQVDAY